LHGYGGGGAEDVEGDVKECEDVDCGGKMGGGEKSDTSETAFSPPEFVTSFDNESFEEQEGCLTSPSCAV
jgi:hypothetical protein